MPDAARRITSFGFHQGPEIAGLWEVHVTLDDERCLTARGSSKREALDALQRDPLCEEFRPLLDAFLAMVPSGWLDQDAAVGTFTTVHAADGEKVDWASVAASFDYNRAFEDGLVFESRHPLVSGPVTIRVLQAGLLAIPSGRIVVRDPGGAPDSVTGDRPLSRAIAPGIYPVLISVAEFGPERREVCAMLRIGLAPAIRWEQAHDEGQEKSFGIAVDTGMGLFASLEAARALTAAERTPTAHWSIPAPLYKAICEDMDRNVHYANLTVDPATSLNLIAFHTGWGDGGYPVFWGFDADGNATALIVDFQLLNPEDWG